MNEHPSKLIERLNSDVRPACRPLIMGILNVTPNSFSDGGTYTDLNAACRRAQEMIQQGVDIIDLGGEASNPGSQSISADEELSRVIPVIEAIRTFSNVCLSIDTCKAVVMREAVNAGASMINDILALRGEGALAVAQTLSVPICLMHMQGTPATMQQNPCYDGDVVDNINCFFQERLEACRVAGIQKDRLILDPGIGFGKTTAHNLRVLNHLADFHGNGRPILLGVSRKRVIGDVLQLPLSERLVGSVATAVYAALQGVRLIRTHDVRETHQALTMLEAINNEKATCQ